MSTALRPRRWIRWLALAVFAGAALAPSVGHALGGGADAQTPWASLCSTLPRGDDGAERADVADFGHCPLCSLHTDALAPPPDAVSIAVLRLNGGAATLERIDAVHAHSGWPAAQARAPPAQPLT